MQIAVMRDQPPQQWQFPLPLCFEGKHFLPLHLSGLECKRIRCIAGGRRDFHSSYQTQTRSPFCVSEKCQGMAFWKPLPDVSPGEEEMDFQIDFISSVWSLILRVVRQENIKIFTYVFTVFFSDKSCIYLKCLHCRDMDAQSEQRHVTSTLSSLVCLEG